MRYNYPKLDVSYTIYNMENMKFKQKLCIRRIKKFLSSIPKILKDTLGTIIKYFAKNRIV